LFLLYKICYNSLQIQGNKINIIKIYATAFRLNAFYFKDDLTEQMKGLTDFLTKQSMHTTHAFYLCVPNLTVLTPAVLEEFKCSVKEGPRALTEFCIPINRVMNRL